MLELSRNIVIPDEELEESFVRASGPGGQNVNKVSSAVQLRFDLRHSPSLPEDVRQRALAQLAPRLTADGVLIIMAQEFRSQERNREAARERLLALLRPALVAPRKRRPTRPSRAAKARRMDKKTKRSGIKKLRGRPSLD